MDNSVVESNCIIAAGSVVTQNTHVPEGSIVALLGANGAGKSTTLKSVSNLLRAERGEVTKGSIEYLGERVDKLSCNDLVKRGVIQVMEGRHCFEHLSVEENLQHFRSSSAKIAL